MEKLEFMNSFIKIYSFKNLADFTTKISTKQFMNNKLFLDKINTEIPKIKKMFSISQMSLSKNNYRIKTPLQAFQLLKHCLQQMNIGFQKLKINNTNYIRLISPNFNYINYINKMSNSKVRELTPNISSKNKDEINYLSFDDFYNDFEIVHVHGDNNKCMKYLYNNDDKKLMSKELLVAENTNKMESFSIGKQFVIREKKIYVLLELPRTHDVINSVKCNVVNPQGILVKENKHNSLLSGRQHVKAPFPLLATQYHTCYVILEFNKKVDLHNEIKCSYNGLCMKNASRAFLAQHPWKFKNEKYRLCGGLTRGDNSFIAKKGTETIGIKFSGLKSVYKLNRMYKQISNIRFKAVTPKNLLGKQSKIKWIMTSMHINNYKTGYYGDHYKDIPIPLYALMYTDVSFNIELSNGLSFDRQDYIEITFDYDNSDDLPNMDGKIIYENFKIIGGLCGPIFT